jgi:Helix-turn-helix domain
MPARPRKTVAEADALRAVGGRTGKVRPAELAEFLRRSQQTLANWRWQGKGPRYVGRGRGILYDWADVGEWLVSLPSGGEGVRRGAA